jgi:hypothetical protein
MSAPPTSTGSAEKRENSSEKREIAERRFRGPRANQKIPAGISARGMRPGSGPKSLEDGETILNAFLDRNFRED